MADQFWGDYYGSFNDKFGIPWYVVVSAQHDPDVTRRAEPQLVPGGVFASNTTTLPITGVAEAARVVQRMTHDAGAGR